MLRRPLPALLFPALLLLACDPYLAWPEAESYFPWVYTPQAGIQDFEEARWESEAWDMDDLEMLGFYIQKAFFHRKGAPREEVAHFDLMREQVPALAGEHRLSVVGDVMWIGDNWANYAEPVAGLLDGDLRLGNLETPTSPDHSTEARALGTYAFNAPTEMLDGLPLDLLQLNNNHSLDAGDLGLENTLAQVAERNFQAVGVDSQAALEVGGRKIAVLAYTWGINDGRRSENGHELHILPFGHLDPAMDLARLEEQVHDARTDGADLVVLMLHWGFEYEYYPDPHFMILARRMIAAGADLILGQGPHVVQPVEICRVNQPEHIPGIGSCSLRTEDGEPRLAAVLYSLGNFGTRMETMQAQVGLVATIGFDSGIAGLAWSAVASVVEDGSSWIRPLEDLLGQPGFAEESTRLEQHLGSGWRR